MGWVSFEKKDIRPSVAVVIEDGNAERFTRAIAQARFACDVFEFAAAEVPVQSRRFAFVGFGRAVRFCRPIERAPEIALQAPGGIIRDQQIGLAVFVVVEPGGAGSKIRVVNAAQRGNVAKMAAPFVMEQAVAVERRDVDVGLAVVVVIGDGHSHAIHLDVEPAAAGDVGKGPVVIVAIQRLNGVTPARREIFSVH